MTSLITSQCDVKVAWLQEMDTDSAYMSKSQYMQSYWFSNKSNNNIIYNISVMTITITIIIILTNFGKYAISDCLFIFLLSHLKLITLPMHSPTNTRHNITSKDKFGTGTAHLADMPTAVHRQNSWKITGWSNGTASMAMHCYNKLTPDGVWRTTFFTQQPLWQFLTPGLRHFFLDSPCTLHHCAPLETIPVETLPMTNVTHKLLVSGQQHMWPHPQAITRRYNDV